MDDLGDSRIDNAVQGAYLCLWNCQVLAVFGLFYCG